MHLLERQGYTDIVVNVLAQVEFVAFRNITFLETGLDRQFQILKTTIAGHCHGTVDITLDIYCSPMVMERDFNLQIGPQNIRIAENAKELAVGAPLLDACASGQIVDFNYKGLQR